MPGPGIQSNCCKSVGLPYQHFLLSAALMSGGGGGKGEGSTNDKLLTSANSGRLMLYNIGDLDFRKYFHVAKV